MTNLFLKSLFYFFTSPFAGEVDTRITADEEWLKNKSTPHQALRASFSHKGRSDKIKNLLTKLKELLALILLFIPLCSFAADIYPFNNPNDAERFKILTTELRCLVCQNQNLSESNAPLANDLRQQIYLQIKQGKSNQTIVNYLKARYGDFILYRPPLNRSTMILWLGPFLLLIIVISFLIRYLRNAIKD